MKDKQLNDLLSRMMQYERVRMLLKHCKVVDIPNVIQKEVTVGATPSFFYYLSMLGLHVYSKCRPLIFVLGALCFTSQRSVANKNRILPAGN